MPEEVEISERSSGDYEVIPVVPAHKLERRVEMLEKSGTIPQLQSLVNQIIELIRANQKLVDSVIRSDMELRNELSKLPPKIDEMTDQIRKLIDMIEYAGKQEISGVGSETMKPVVENLEKLIESNRSVQESVDNMNRKIKSGTPVSQLFTSYPRLRPRREGEA